MPKIALDVAKKEAQKWLDHKRIKPKKREALSDQIDTIVDGISDGSLILEKNHNFTYTLSFPLKNSDGEETVKTLTFKPRISVKEITARMKGVKSNDADARVLGYIAALIDQPSALLSEMDTEDNSIAQAFATFFL